MWTYPRQVVTIIPIQSSGVVHPAVNILCKALELPNSCTDFLLVIGQYMVTLITTKLNGAEASLRS
jgi:hypothetical protein